MIDPLVNLHLQLDELQTVFSQSSTGINAWLKYVDSKLDADQHGVALFSKDGVGSVVSEMKAEDDKYFGMPRLPLSAIHAKRVAIRSSATQHALLQLRAIVRTFMMRYANRYTPPSVKNEVWLSYELIGAYTGVEPSLCDRFDVVLSVDVRCQAFEECGDVDYTLTNIPRMIGDIATFAASYDGVFRDKHPEVKL